MLVRNPQRGFDADIPRTGRGRPLPAAARRAAIAAGRFHRRQGRRKRRRGADGAFARQDRESHDGRDTVAARCYFDQCILAQFEEGGFTQQVESRGSAHGLFGKNDQVGTLRFRFVDRIDDFRGIAVDIPDRIVQLGKGYFHLSVILVGKLQRRKVKDYL